MITKDNIRLTHSDGMWLAEIIPDIPSCAMAYDFGRFYSWSIDDIKKLIKLRYRNSWGWSESPKQAVRLALGGIR